MHVTGFSKHFVSLLNFEETGRTYKKKVDNYEKWREWWKPLILKTIEDGRASFDMNKSVEGDDMDGIKPEGSSKD